MKKLKKRIAPLVALTGVMCGCCVAALGAEASVSLVFDGTVRCGSYVDSPAGAEQTFACWFKALGQGEGDKPYDRSVVTLDDLFRE